MYLKTTFTLSLTIDSERFYKLLHKAELRSEYESYNDEADFVDNDMTHKGLTVIYQNKIYKKKLKLLISANTIIDNDDINADRLLLKLEKRIAKYFKGKYQLKDFTLTGMNLYSDINVQSREGVKEYINIMHRIGRVKGYSQSESNPFDDDISYWLSGNSNHIEFFVLDLEGALKSQLKDIDDNRKQLKSIKDDSAGILRVEVRLTKAKAIRAFTTGTIVSVQLAELVEKRQYIYFELFYSIIPFGDFYKKEKTIELIRGNKDIDTTIKRKMIRLVELIPEKRSLLLAQKALDYRRIDEVMERFSDIEVSPVTISKRADVKHLQNLIKYM